MFFVNDEHQQNYNKLRVLFLGGRSDREYQTACYVLALPEIYYKVDWNKINYPFDFLRWRGKNHVDLSSGYRSLVDAARNLFNSSNSFNLMEGLSCWDDKLRRVFFQAVDIRLGKAG